MRRNITGGIILILLSIIIIGSGMGFIPNIPWFKLFCTVVFAAIVLKSLVKREFFSCIMALCCLAWMYDDLLGIESITPFPLFFAGILLAIGLGMIFKSSAVKTFYKDGDNWYYGRSVDVTGKEEWQDGGRHVSLENNFNSVSKYVNAQAFSTAELENNFGSANIYFNNAVMAGREANVKLENNFGQMNVYFPNTWRVSLSQETGFGRINVYGDPNHDMDAPHVIIKAESNFGELNIYFG